MRIKDKISRQLDTASRKLSTVKEGTTSFFAAELTRQENDVDSYAAEMEDLRRDIESAGDQLEIEPTLGNFQKFRNLLSKLAKRINNEAYRLEKVGGTPQNPRYFEVIRVIDHEADRLYNLIVREQKDHMAITAKVIGIKGLVIDLIT